MTTAQYKAKFDAAAAQSEVGTGVDTFNTKPEAKHAWAMIAAVWAFLWVERAQMDKHAITPSTTANGYLTKCETFQAKAEADAGGIYAASNAPKIVAWCAIAQNYAYAWLELTRAETNLPA